MRSSSSDQSSQIKQVIKELLKKADYTYEDLAKALHVSLPTVRRFLTKEDIGLERLLAICDWLGISLEELGALANRVPLKITYLSEVQESFFASFPDAYTYLRYLGRGLRPQEIEEQYGISAKATRWYLNELSALELIDVTSTNKVRFKIPWPANWLFPGPLEKKFGRAIYHAATDHLLKRVGGISGKFEDADFFLMLDSILLCDRSYEEYLNELRGLYRKYSTIGRHELKTMPRNRLHLTSVLHGIDRADFITEGMAQVKERK